MLQCSKTCSDDAKRVGVQMAKQHPPDLGRIRDKDVQQPLVVCWRHYRVPLRAFVRVPFKC